MLDPNQIFVIFATLVGFPALVAAVVNVLKYFNVVTDTQAPKAVSILTLLGFVGVGIAYYTGNVPILSGIDAQLGQVATFLTTFLAFVIDLGLAKVAHASLRGTPFIGKSYSA
jgi:hypothetical protein